MTRIFDGTFKDFQIKLFNIGIFGKWKEQPNGVWQLKTNCGTLSWSDTQRTFWTQGTVDQKERLDKLLAACFDDRPGAYRLVVVGNDDKTPYDQLVTMLHAAGLNVISAGRA